MARAPERRGVRLVSSARDDRHDEEDPLEDAATSLVKQVRAREDRLRKSLKRVREEEVRTRDDLKRLKANF